MNKIPTKIVLFYSESCEPCQFMKPIIEEISEKENILLERVCVDTSAGVKHGEKYNIVGWPTLFAVQNDYIVAELMGADPSSDKETEVKRIYRKIISTI